MRTEVLKERTVCVVTLTNKGLEINVSKWNRENSLDMINDFYEKDLNERVKYIFEPDKVNIYF